MLLKQFTYGTNYCAIEHTVVNNTNRFNVLQLTYKKKALEIASSETFTNVNDAINSIPKKQHVFVIINTDKVLSKKIEGIHELNKAVSLAFPNIKTSDFTIEVLPQETHSFVSVCRNQDVEKILSEYKKESTNVIGFSLGSNSVATITSYINQDIIQTSNTVISVNDDNISSIVKTDDQNHQKYDINGLKVTSSDVLTLSGILSYYIDNNPTESNFEEQTSQLKDNFKQKQIFSNALKFGLGFIFFGLLINFLFFTHYRDQISSLSNEQQVNERSKESLLTLTSEVNRKRSLVSDITTSTGSKVSFYLDEIGGSVPTSISLDEIAYQPLQKSIKTNKEIEISSNSIAVSGVSSNSDEFSDWISKLESNNWIEKVVYLEYGIGKKSKTAFKINIDL